MAVRAFLFEGEVVLTNYIDVILAVLLVLAFVKGFSGGLWRSIFNLGSTAAAFAGAYLLASPVVNLIDRNYRVLSGMSSWWKNVFRSLPGLSLPYDPSTLDEALAAAGGSSWMGALKGALRQSIVAVQQAAGPNPTWGSVLALALSRLILSAAVFLVTLAVLRLACNLVSGSLAFGLPASFTARLLGGLLETCLTAVWLSILAGILSPLFTSGFLRGTGKAAESSTLFGALLAVYGFLWPAIIARVK